MKVIMGDFIISAIKFIFSFLILPVVIFSVTNFLKLLSGYSAGLGDFFVWGVGSFIFAYLFIYQFWNIYEFGQNVVRVVFGIFAPANLLISRFIPLYLTIVYVSYCMADKVFGIRGYDQYFMFFAGFFFGMHILSTAQDLQDQEKFVVNPSYWITMEMIIIFNVCLAVVVFDFTNSQITFPRFFDSILLDVKNIYLNLLDFVY